MGLKVEHRELRQTAAQNPSLQSEFHSDRQFGHRFGAALIGRNTEPGGEPCQFGPTCIHLPEPGGEEKLSGLEFTKAGLGTLGSGAMIHDSNSFEVGLQSLLLPRLEVELDLAKLELKLDKSELEL